MEIEKDNSEESKEESTKELEEKYTTHQEFITIAHFDCLQNAIYQIDQEKIISQIHQEISTPPPNC